MLHGKSRYKTKNVRNTEIPGIIENYAKKEGAEIEKLDSDSVISYKEIDQFISIRIIARVKFLDALLAVGGYGLGTYWGVQIYIYDLGNFRRIYLFSEDAALSFFTSINENASNYKMSKIIRTLNQEVPLKKWE